MAASCVATGGGSSSGRSFPTLGFDPAEGDIAAVIQVEVSLTDAQLELAECASRMQEALEVSDDWDGDAADDFHDYGDDLPQAFERGNKSLVAAAQAMGKWAGTMKANQEEADRLEREAKQLKKQLDSATEAVGEAAVSVGHAHSAASQTKANNALTSATLDQMLAQQAFDDVISRAERLKAKHLRDANATAEAIGKDSDDSFKPESDGWFVQAVDGVAKVSGVVSTVAGTIAVASLVIPGAGEVIAPIAGTVAMGAAGVNSIAGLAQHAAGSRNAIPYPYIALGLLPTRVISSPVVNGTKAFKGALGNGTGVVRATRAARIQGVNALKTEAREAPLIKSGIAANTARKDGLDSWLNAERLRNEQALHDKGKDLAKAVNKFDSWVGGSGDAATRHTTELGRLRSAHEAASGTIDGVDKTHRALDPSYHQSDGDRRALNIAKQLANPGRDGLERFTAAEIAAQINRQITGGK